METRTRKGVALLIGIGEYRLADRVERLRCAVDDARAMAAHLVDPEVGGFDPEDVVVLVDAEAGRDEVVGRISNWLPRAARGADLVVLFFAGHGMTRRVGARDEGFLLPHDADPDDLVTRGIGMGELTRWIEGIDAGAVVVILDCCHSGMAIRRGPGPPEAPRRDVGIRPSALLEVSGKDPSGRGRFLIAACDEGQSSFEVPDLGHGLFTHHLLRGMAGEADRDDDGQVGVQELFEYVADAVALDARARFGFDQRPWYSVVGAGRVVLSTSRKRRDRKTGPFGPEGEPGESLASTLAREVDRAFGAVGSRELIRALGRLGKLDDPDRFPPLFRCLAHPEPEVRERARSAFDAIGWAPAAATIAEHARRWGDERMGSILDGLEAFVAHPDLIALLDRLTMKVRGDLLERAVALLDRKRLAIDLERVAASFREEKSHYRIEKVLGQGILTAAYLARDEEHEIDVVVRILRPEFAARPMVRSDFLDLSRRCVGLVHQNLVSTREARSYHDRNIHFAVRQHVDGLTLRKLLQGGTSLPPRRILAILRQILEGLGPLHEADDPIPHGGLKPSKVYLTRRDRVVLGDPSVSIRERGGMLQRSPLDHRYSPPESFQARGKPDIRSDYYALGCIAYELFRGSPPFASDDLIELGQMHRQVPHEPASRGSSPFGKPGDLFLDRLLAKTPEGRPEDGEELAEELDRLERSTRGWGGASEAAINLRHGLVSMHEGVQSLFEIGPKGGPLRPHEVSPTAEPPDPSPTPPPEDVVPESKPEPIPAELPPPESSHSDPGDGELANEDPGEIDPYWTLPPGINHGTVVESTPTKLWSEGPGAIEPGQTLFSKYEVIRLLGVGGMGSVWLVRHLMLERVVALKTLAPHLATNPDSLTRFAREFRIMASLVHPHAVQINDAELGEGGGYIDMEFVDGPTLQDVLAAQRRREDLDRGEPLLGFELILRVLDQLCEVLEVAHAMGITHRDIKPGNLILLRDRSPGREHLRSLISGSPSSAVTWRAP